MGRFVNAGSFAPDLEQPRLSELKSLVIKRLMKLVRIFSCARCVLRALLCDWLQGGGR